MKKKHFKLTLLFKFLLIILLRKEVLPTFLPTLNRWVGIGFVYKFYIFTVMLKPAQFALLVGSYDTHGCIEEVILCILNPSPVRYWSSISVKNIKLHKQSLWSVGTGRGHDVLRYKWCSINWMANTNQTNYKFAVGNVIVYNPLVKFIVCYLR